MHAPVKADVCCSWCGCARLTPAQPSGMLPSLLLPLNEPLPVYHDAHQLRGQLIKTRSEQVFPTGDKP